MKKLPFVVYALCSVLCFLLVISGNKNEATYLAAFGAMTLSFMGATRS